MARFEENSVIKSVTASPFKREANTKRNKLHHASSSFISTACLFPEYGRCQTLLLFPQNFASCLNSGDFGSLSRLLKSRVDKRCRYEVFGQKMDLDTVVRIFELQDELHPDSVTNVRNTRVIRNEVRSFFNFKYTANKTIEASLRRCVQDQSVLQMCPVPHADPVCLHQFIESKPAEDRLALLTLTYTAEELIVQGKARMTLIIDDVTKKITHFSIACQFTSFEAV